MMPQPSSSTVEQPQGTEPPQEGVGETEETPEGEDEVLQVEMPPPMDEIQTHALPPIGDTSQEDVQSKLVSSLLEFLCDYVREDGAK